MALADELFRDNCQRILREGQEESGAEIRARWADGSPAGTIRLFGLVNRYDLSQEFPILTLRPTPFRNCVDELLWIWQKKSNRVADLNSHIWDAWADEQGTIGKAYGYQLAKKSQYPEGLFDQVDRVRYELKHCPHSRRILTNIYCHEDLHEMGLYPCAWSVTFQVCHGNLNAILNQRSQDMLVANNWNVTQYAVLVHLLAREAGLAVGELIHVISDAHIYLRHIPIIEDLLKREAYPAPTLVLDQAPLDFYEVKVSDLKLDGYQHGERVRDIEVAI